MQKLSQRHPLGRTDVAVPPIVFGTSCLGNLYKALTDDTKLDIAREWFKCVAPPVALDTAGKYGAGLALEVIGRCLDELAVASENVVISNKLGWVRTPLVGPDPTFEPGVWQGLEHDAEQRISYRGILDCWQQGCDLLGGGRKPQLVSVHDPDEYLVQAVTAADRERRFDDFVDAYRALAGLRDAGEVRAVGVGSKDWTVIRELSAAVKLDWVMLAVSLTIMHHPPELLAFVDELAQDGIGIINSAVFHAGFLTGGEFYDYRKVDPSRVEDAPLFTWRDHFHRICARHGVDQAEACVQFGLSPPGVLSVALNTSRPGRVAANVGAVQAEIPRAFWGDMKATGLISEDYPHVG